jgi:lincosamide nucleotidyltransferase A/C/D/E
VPFSAPGKRTCFSSVCRPNRIHVVSFGYNVFQRGRRYCELRFAGAEEATTRMTSDAVLEFLDLMDVSSLDVCLDGGWGVDALLGEQTREHGDLDIIVRVEDAPRLVTVTRASGYAVQPGGSEANFVVKSESGHAVDVHAITFDGRGFGVFALPDGRVWPFPPSAFRGRGRIGGKDVRCLTPEAQVQCHAQGYAPDEADLQDMKRLQDRFGVVLPLALCQQPGVEGPGMRAIAEPGAAADRPGD